MGERACAYRTLAAFLGAPQSGSKLDALGPTLVKCECLPPFSWKGLHGMVDDDVRLKSDALAK
jgi:hypothetical protein